MAAPTPLIWDEISHDPADVINLSGIVHGMPDDVYHAHPALSSTGARKLIPPGCPAAFDHYRRNGRPLTKAFRKGLAVHREILGTGSEIVVVDEWSDWRTNAAKEKRAKIEGAGDGRRIAMLEHEYEQVAAMRDALAAHPTWARVFDPGRGTPEVSLFWTDQDTGVPCRARLDWLPNPAPGRRLVVVDYKTTGESAEPTMFAKSAAAYGYPQQADWYRRGIQAVGLHRDPGFVFLAQETEPPHLITAGRFNPSDEKVAHGLNTIALRRYAECEKSGRWPGYADEVVTLTAPAWWQMQAEELINEHDDIEGGDQIWI